MKAQELRIGNWVEFRPDSHKRYNNQRQVKVVEIDRNGILADDGKVPIGLRFDSDALQPIPLSPEVLTACGFEKIGEDGYIIYEFEDEKNPNEGFRVEYEGEGYVYYYPSNTAMDVQINYLHQLQNLFYYLTGEELNYTP
jgi:hypothetical protein